MLVSIDPNSRPRDVTTFDLLYSTLDPHIAFQADHLRRASGSQSTWCTSRVQSRGSFQIPRTSHGPSRCAVPSAHPNTSKMSTKAVSNTSQTSAASLRCYLSRSSPKSVAAANASTPSPISPTPTNSMPSPATPGERAGRLIDTLESSCFSHSTPLCI